MTVMVTTKHLRAAGICIREPRLFCRAQGWSWSEFIKVGLSADLLESTGDPMAIRVAAIARKEAAE